MRQIPEMYEGWDEYEHEQDMTNEPTRCAIAVATMILIGMVVLFAIFA